MAERTTSSRLWGPCRADPSRVRVCSNDDRFAFFYSSTWSRLLSLSFSLSLSVCVCVCVTIQAFTRPTDHCRLARVEKERERRSRPTPFLHLSTSKGSSSVSGSFPSLTDPSSDQGMDNDINKDIQATLLGQINHASQDRDQTKQSSWNNRTNRNCNYNENEKDEDPSSPQPEPFGSCPVAHHLFCRSWRLLVPVHSETTGRLGSLLLLIIVVVVVVVNKLFSRAFWFFVNTARDTKACRSWSQSHLNSLTVLAMVTQTNKDNLIGFTVGSVTSSILILAATVLIVSVCLSDYCLFVCLIPFRGNASSNITRCFLVVPHDPRSRN